MKFEDGNAHVSYDPNIVTASRIVKLIESLGYAAVPEVNYLKTRFFVTGMRCMRCVNKIESNIKEVLGVSEIKVSMLRMLAYAFAACSLTCTFGFDR